MRKITWAIANADVKSGKPYVCGFIDRSKKDEQGKSPTMSLNTDTKTKQESCYSARVVMYIRSYQDCTGTNALRSSPSLCFGSDIWRARMCIHAGSWRGRLVWRPEQRMLQSNLAMRSSQQTKTSRQFQTKNLRM